MILRQGSFFGNFTKFYGLFSLACARKRLHSVRERTIMDTMMC